jgi:predicted RNase H-like HicB family nuclease
LKKAYTVVHVDTGQGVEAWFPDFPGLTVPGDQLADTLLSAPLVLRRHVEQLKRDGLLLPEPTTPDIWAVHDQLPEALVGFAEVETD